MNQNSNLTYKSLSLNDPNSRRSLGPLTEVTKHVIPLCCALILALILSACSPGKEEVVQPSAAPILPTTQDTGTEESPSVQVSESELLESISGEMLGVPTEVQFDYEDELGVVFVRWEIASENSNEKIIAGAKQDTVVILRTIYLSGLDFEEIWLSGWYTVTIDINANTAPAEMVFLKYERETIAQLHWDRVRSQFIWDITRWKGLHDLFK